MYEIKASIFGGWGFAGMPLHSTPWPLHDSETSASAL